MMISEIIGWLIPGVIILICFMSVIPKKAKPKGTNNFIIRKINTLKKRINSFKERISTFRKKIDEFIEFKLINFF